MMSIFSRIKWPQKYLLLKIFLVGLIICLSWYWIPVRSSGSHARIKDVLITNNASDITVFAKVSDCFNQKMENAILAGAPTTFTFLVELYWEREGHVDKKISSKRIKQTVKYDLVKKIFFMSSTESRQISEFQDMHSAKKAMSELNGVVLAPVSSIQKNRKYYIRIKAKLDKIRLPMHMEHVFFFVSLWDFETDWYQQKLLHSSW